LVAPDPPSRRAPLLHRFAPHVAELPVARHALRDWLAGQALDVDAAEELLVVATELCTDAVRVSTAGLVTLRAWRDDDAVVVEVEAAAPAGGRRAAVRHVGEEAERGMLIVRSLCDDVSVVVRGRNRFVRCRKELRGLRTFG
jgi:anti-sigma regulatory factor (Ser/Thr protein kinase)